MQVTHSPKATPDATGRKPPPRRVAQRGVLAAVAVSTSLGFVFIGCADPLYMLGTLPGEASSKPDPCRADGSPDSGVGCTVRSTRRDAAPPDARVLPDASLAPVDGATPASTDASSDGALPCADLRAPAVRKGLSLFLLADDSLSVLLRPMWVQVTQAITGFVDDRANAGLGIGIAYYGLSCNPADYSAPAVGLAPLPGVAAAVKASYPVPISGKAITPALKGTLGYLRVAAANDPDRAVALVLMSDGIADPLCGSNITNAASEVSAARTATPAISTYVIALGAGPNFLDPANLADIGPLDLLAAAGGTGRAARVALDIATNEELSTALHEIVARAAPCAYRIPAQMVPARTSAEWTRAAPERAVLWPRVRDEAACGTSPGVFVRSDAPGYLELCPAACSAVQANPSGTVVLREDCVVR